MYKNKLSILALNLAKTNNLKAAKEILKISAERFYESKEELPENVIGEIIRRSPKSKDSIDAMKDELISLIDSGFASCAYCGKKIKTKERIPLDRVDNKNPIYSLGNIVWACWDCNRLKSSLPLDNFLEDISKIYRHLGPYPGSLEKINRSKESLEEDVNIIRQELNLWKHNRKILSRSQIKYDDFAKEIFEEVFVASKERYWKEVLVELKAKHPEFAWDSSSFRNYLNKFKIRVSKSDTNLLNKLLPYTEKDVREALGLPPK